MTWQKHWYIITNLSVMSGVILTLILTMLSFYLRTYRKNERNQEVAARNPTVITNQFFREYWYWLIEPLINFLTRIKLNPNTITKLSTVVGFAAGVLYAYGHISTAGWMLLLSGGLDTVDGQLARRLNISSNAGAFFDSVMDRYADFFVFAGIILRFSIMDEILNISTPDPGAINRYLVFLTLLCILGAQLISYAKERGSNLGVNESTGLMQRADRVTVLGIASILDPLFINLARFITDIDLANHHYTFGIGLLAIALFSNHTAMRRINTILRKLKEQNQ